MAEAPRLLDRIDAHHHLWRYTPEEFGWIGPEMSVLQRDYLVDDLASATATAGVKGTVAVQARQSLAETRWLLELAEEHPLGQTLIQGVVGWVPLRSPELPGILSQLARRTRLKGVRHVVQDEPDDDFLLGPEFNRGVAALLDTGLVYDVLIHERHLPQAAAFVRQHPQQVFVLDHLAKPRIREQARTPGRDPREQAAGPWRDNLRRLAECPNVYCKLSGLVTEADWATWTADDLAPYLDEALRAFGAERLMAGSDWPVCLVASSYRRWWATLEAWAESLSREHRECLLGATARKVYRL